MSDLYLIAHKVRGSAAFDIATRSECPECMAMGCPECDDLGYWWIVPTSGHRAYPWWSKELYMGFSIDDIIVDWPMPTNLQDHYTVAAAPTFNLTRALGLDKPQAPTASIVRRF